MVRCAPEVRTSCLSFAVSVGVNSWSSDFGSNSFAQFPALRPIASKRAAHLCLSACSMSKRGVEPEATDGSVFSFLGTFIGF